MRKLTDAGLHVGVNPNPVMPMITDGERHLDRLAKAARDAGARSLGGGPLFLMPCARKVFFPFLETHFPQLLPQYRAMYENSAYLGNAYKEMLRARIQRIRDRYGLDSKHADYQPELWQGNEQGELFPLQ